MAILAIKPASGSDDFQFQDSSGNAILQVDGDGNRVDYKKGISEKVGTITGTAGAVTLDLSTGTFFEVTLTAAITTWAISNVPPSGTACSWIIKIKQAATAITGTPVTWTGDGTTTPTGAFNWHLGTDHTMSTGNNEVDIISMFTIDGGTTIYSILTGKAFAT